MFEIICFGMICSRKHIFFHYAHLNSIYCQTCFECKGEDCVGLAISYFDFGMGGVNSLGDRFINLLQSHLFLFLKGGFNKRGIMVYRYKKLKWLKLTFCLKFKLEPNNEAYMTNCTFVTSWYITFRNSVARPFGNSPLLLRALSRNSLALFKI